MSKVAARVIEVLPGEDEPAGVRSSKVRAVVDGPGYKRSNAIFLVRVVQAKGPFRQQTEEGSMMEHGTFEFEAQWDVQVGEKLKVNVEPMEA